MTVIHLPDLSQHNATVDMSKVGPAVILRAHNGNRPDAAFSARQADARKHCIVRGFYVYLVPGRPAADQAREAAAIIGKLQPGEFAIVDAEVGDGDQSARVEAACDILDAHCGGQAWVYSGESFAHDHLTHLSGRRLWIAAYRATEPRGPHALWQHSDHEPHPGVGAVDCSIFHGTAQQLRALITPAAPIVKPHVAAKPTAVKPAAKPAPSFRYTRTLKQGMSGQDVAHLRKRLNLRPGITFGPLTDAKLRAFQHAHPPLAVDGVCGPNTQAVLK